MNSIILLVRQCVNLKNGTFLAYVTACNQTPMLPNLMGALALAVVD